MKRTTQFIGLTLVVTLLASCAGKQLSISNGAQAKIKANQLDYYIGNPKKAIVPGEGKSEFFLVDETTGKIVFTGTLPEGKLFEPAGEVVAIADFSSFEQPGTYRLAVNDSLFSNPFRIEMQPATKVTRAAIKALWYNRAGYTIPENYGGKWARAAGHPDTLVFVHESAATKARPAGFTFSSPKGWYDAGDYNKYIVNSAITTYTMMEAYHYYKSYFDSLKVDFPENGNNLPDLLDETLYNLRWMITMQDPNDGGVYHKLTNKSFDWMVMPDQCHNERYVVQKNTAATLDYAATMARSARLFKGFESQLPGWGDSCLVAAKKAWDWAIQNPDITYQQPGDIFTGGYGDHQLTDEWFWAACELWLATGDEAYKAKIAVAKNEIKAPDWGDVYTLGAISLLSSNGADAQLAKEGLLALADSLTTVQQQSAYNTSITRFRWGSNSDVANYGMVKLVAYRQTGDRKYLESALYDMDYILGANATGYCFVTGFGTRSPMNIHHRPSAADGIEAPIPGFLSGGPNLSVMTDCDSTGRSPYPAASFQDMLCSYSTNEIAINWNAPLIFLSGGIDAEILSTQK